MITTDCVLRGEFINLRPLTRTDAEITYLWRRSVRAIHLNQGTSSLEDQEKWISSRPASEYNFIIELKNEIPVGMLSLVNIDNVNRRAEPGRFLIGDASSVKGVPAAVEAMKLLYEFAFNTLNLVRVCGTIASDNHLMTKWQKYLGMKEEGRLRNHYFINGHFQDAIFLGLLAEEFRSVTLPRMQSLLAAGRSSKSVSNSKSVSKLTT